MPELFYVECGGVLRRWDLNRVLGPAKVADDIAELKAWPLRVTQVRGLFETLGDCGATSRSLTLST